MGCENVVEWVRQTLLVSGLNITNTSTNTDTHIALVYGWCSLTEG